VVGSNSPRSLGCRAADESVWLAQWLCARWWVNDRVRRLKRRVGVDHDSLSSCARIKRHRSWADRPFGQARPRPDPRHMGSPHLITSSGGDSGCGEWRGRWSAVRKSWISPQRGGTRRNTAGSFAPSSGSGFILARSSKSHSLEANAGQSRLPSVSITIEMSQSHRSAIFGRHTVPRGGQRLSSKCAKSAAGER